MTHAKGKLETGALSGLVSLDIDKAFDHVLQNDIIVKMSIINSSVPYT